METLHPSLVRLDCPPNNITDLAEPAERIGDLRQAALCAAAFAKVEIGDRFCGKVAMAKSHTKEKQDEA